MTQREAELNVWRADGAGAGDPGDSMIGDERVAEAAGVGARGASLEGRR
jgi:hypothetical protein